MEDNVEEIQQNTHSENIEDGDNRGSHLINAISTNISNRHEIQLETIHSDPLTANSCTDQ